MDSVLLQLLLWFIQRQLAKFGSTIDWDKVKADAADRIAHLLPGDVFDSAVQHVVSEMIDMVGVFCKQPDAQSAIGTDQMPKMVHAAMNAASQNLITKLSKTVVELKK